MALDNNREILMDFLSRKNLSNKNRKCDVDKLIISDCGSLDILMDFFVR